ncbi:MAG: c(7)-type cytochrome triheme domain-containing protein [Acidobacteriota bacterium]
MKREMRLVVLAVLMGGLAGLSVAGFSQESKKKPPAQIVFEAKLGKVTFDHAKHVEREKNDCKVCHDKLFPQSKAPLNFGKGMHKPAEAAKTSCAACHVADGKAFESKGNCKKCHVKS